MLDASAMGIMVKHQGSNHPPGRPGVSRSGQQVNLWADLLNDLDQGEPSISTSATEMAEDVPAGLRLAVNSELERRGCRFRIRL